MEYALVFLTSLVWLATLTAALGHAWWVFELATHFRLQYAVAASFCALGFAAVRDPLGCAAAAACAAINWMALAPLYDRRGRLGPAKPPAGGHGSKAVRILTMNVNYRNQDAARVLRYIRKTDPDIVVIIEANAFWMQELTPLRKTLRFVEGFTKPSGYGMLLFSRLPVEYSTREGLGQEHLPCIVARLTVEGRPLTLIAAHPVSPTKARKAAYRNWQLGALGRLAAGSDAPVVMVGDMNTTRWSPHFRLLLDGTGLRDTQEGRGTQVTWPAGWPLVGIAIDHCLVSHGIAVHDRRVGPSIGSDHLPLLVEVSLAS